MLRLGWLKRGRLTGKRQFSSGGGDGTALSRKGPVGDFTDTRPLPSHAKGVIIGGGVVGCSVAYHLTKLGFKDIVLVESGNIGCGTTWHAAGLIGQMRSTAAETQLSGVYGTKLYAELEKETGYSTGFRRVGSLTLAQTEDRMTLLRRNASRAKAFGIEAHMISPEEAGKLWLGHLRTDDLKGALWLPGDGTATSSDLAASLAAGAKQGGARIYEKTKVEAITTGKPTGRRSHVPEVQSVTTSKGTITCDFVVNCGGQWARKIGQMAGVSVPLHSAEHFYIVTKPYEPAVPVTLPVMRDPDVYTYYREWSGGIVMGGFEPKCKPCFTDGVPEGFEFALLSEDWDHFSVLMDGAIHRVPSLETAQVKMVNGPESFTPDNQYILGEAPECRKFYVAAGFNSSGIASAGGAGRALAEWIVQDRPTLDVWSVDIRRFGKFHNNSTFLRDRTFETLGLHYQINWPKRELVSARPVRRSPLNHRLEKENAFFGSKYGWERPNFFSPKGTAPTIEYSFGRQNWFPYSGKEHEACRTDVAIFDQSSFSKFYLQGKDALSELNRLCCNDMAVEVGKVVYTAMLNHKGGIESDVTVTRLDDEQFLLVTSTAQGTRDADWIRRNLRPDAACVLTDVTAKYSVIGVFGPNSRKFLSGLTRADLSNKAFPFGTSREIELGYSTVRASRITYVGELGWELYVSTDMAVSVYDYLKQGAVEQGVTVKDAGYYAIDSLRVEKAYRAWGHDISPDTTPLEAGLGFAVKFDKGTEFIGEKALKAQKALGVKGLTKRLVNFVFKDAQPYPLGDEPILVGGKLVGYVSSAAYGHTLGRGVCLGYVRNPDGVTKQYIESEQFSIEVGGVAWPVTASLAPHYDPTSARVKA